VEVRFTVDRQGRVTSSHISRSSNHQVLDDEVLGLMNRVNPLPPFPSELEESVLTITVPIVFKIP
jgi:protein TonB